MRGQNTTFYRVPLLAWNYSKNQKRTWPWSHDLLFTFWYPVISLEWLKIQTSKFARRLTVRDIKLKKNLGPKAKNLSAKAKTKAKDLVPKAKALGPKANNLSAKAKDLGPKAKTKTKAKDLVPKAKNLSAKTKAKDLGPKAKNLGPKAKDLRCQGQFFHRSFYIVFNVHVLCVFLWVPARYRKGPLSQIL